MDWKLIMLQACAYLIEKHGPEILDAIGDLILALIKSLTPAEKMEFAKKIGIPKNIIDEIWKMPTAVT